MAERLKVKFDGANKCRLCYNAPCTKYCPQQIPVSDLLRSLYFKNMRGAIEKLGDKSCRFCNAPCETHCLLSKYTSPVSIRELMMTLEKEQDALFKPKLNEVDITANLCGIPLENPFLLSSSVVGSSYEMCARAFEAGWAGVSFKTICSFPQHETSPRFSAIRSHSYTFSGFKNIEQLSDHSIKENLDSFRRLKKDYPHKVIVASIMGQSKAEWTELAKQCEDAGADAIECNFSCPNMENNSLGLTIGQSETLVERFTKAVKSGTSLPVLVKLTPNVQDMIPFALAAKHGGADGISAINTISSITGIKLWNLVAEPEVNGRSMIGGYSGKAVKPIALRFISELSNCPELGTLHISGIGGIEDWSDALEFLALGAGTVQVTTAIMQYGYRIIDDLIDGVKNYLRIMRFPCLDNVIGAAKKTVVPHEQVERDTILLPVIQNEYCIGCGRCYISCYDGGHQAITFDDTTRSPKIDGTKCVGCHLCKIVCPANAITTASKRIPAIRS